MEISPLDNLYFVVPKWPLLEEDKFGCCIDSQWSGG